MSTHPSDANRITKLKEFLPEVMKYFLKICSNDLILITYNLPNLFPT